MACTKYGQKFEQNGNVLVTRSLKLCCHAYLRYSVKGSENREAFSSQLEQRRTATFSFSKYAAQNVFHHANAAANAIPQQQFVNRFAVTELTKVVNILEKHEIPMLYPEGGHSLHSGGSRLPGTHSG
ncbi:hypothetical protein AAL_00039 [Moelleriella libera RCEF 2490]|uniref:Uncharacterized protein n=1 Tax=Moelleriella libera RCEF 2490 TaxID=1081109 RepID=A0A166UIF1_9HYPO|nr:hypothetical protein AAL_00039 [Moelleriella libera RCEF 2490]